jgi:hypothetical protein
MASEVTGNGRAPSGILEYHIHLVADEQATQHGAHKPVNYMERWNAASMVFSMIEQLRAQVGITSFHKEMTAAGQLPQFWQLAAG